MLDREHGDIVFRCDGQGCGEFLEAHTSNFDSARNLLRRARWRPRKGQDSEWRHLCPDCQEQRLV